MRTGVHFGSEITQQAITNFPLPNFRDYHSLVNLVAGATPARFQNLILNTPATALSTNINGTNRTNNVTRINGAASINVWLLHHAGYIAPAETIETVTITSGSGEAKQGLSGDASTTVITKSGTNEVHGSTFMLFDNDKLRARNFFAQSKPTSNFKNFGGTVGGPIQRNKVFYFPMWVVADEVSFTVFLYGGMHLTQVVATSSGSLPWRIARGISLNSRPGSPARTHGRCRETGGRCARHCGHRTGRSVVTGKVGGVGGVLAVEFVSNAAERLLSREQLDPVRRDSD